MRKEPNQRKKKKGEQKPWGVSRKKGRILEWGREVRGTKEIRIGE